MNDSGRAVRQLVEKIDVAANELVLIYDDIDLPLGQIRIRPQGSSGTHRGMKSVIQWVGSKEFPRIRIGIHDPQRRVTDITRYVLTPMRGKRFERLQEGVHQAVEAVFSIVETDIHSTMNRLNRRKNSLLLAEQEAAKP